MSIGIGQLTLHNEMLAVMQTILSLQVYNFARTVTLSYSQVTDSGSYLFKSLL